MTLAWLTSGIDNIDQLDIVMYPAVIRYEDASVARIRVHFRKLLREDTRYKIHMK
jgi:hypothetical protein